MQEQISIGGFPAICIPEDEKGFGGLIAYVLLFEEEYRFLIDLREKGFVSQELISAYQERLPKLFALMHFLTDSLRKNKKVMLIAHLNQEKQINALGWFEQRNGEIYYCYIDPTVEGDLICEKSTYYIIH
ncbi:hypothetical protein KAU19_01655 [Candidatus Parcubacteria bacterium]|nr:hypothetical protein [Candidatus Parcubacteria bacterium]